MHGTIVAPQPEAVEAGALALRRGGNAVDAGIACALAETVVDPQMCGIAGFGSMQVFMPKRGVHVIIDFHAKAPAAARPDMWEHLIVGEAPDGFGFLLQNHVNEIGYQSIGVPGSLKAFAEVLAEFGTMDFTDILRPAIELAHAGFVVRPHVHYAWTMDESGAGRVGFEARLRFSPTGRQVYFHPDGRLKRPGERVINPDLARTLGRIAAEGPETFYTGAMAEEVAADMAAHGAILGRDDLRNYRTTRTEPLWGSYRGHRIASNRPPGGGVVLLELLHIMGQFDLVALGHNTAEYIAVLAEAMKRVTIDKDAHVGDPAFVDVPLDRLLSNEYAGATAASIRAGERAHVTRLKRTPEPRSTTHISSVDAEGNAFAMTHTLGMPSGVITDGLGFMYNGTMAVFDPRPGRAGSIAPGKGRFSSMAPSIVFEGDRPLIVIGAPGGTYIALALAQGIINMLDFGMSISDAVAAPRISATSDSVDVSNRIPRYVTDAVEATGHKVHRSYLSYAFAGLHGIHLGARVAGGADPQRDGMALSV